MIVAAHVAELVVQGAVGLGAAAIGAAATLYTTTKAASGALTTAIEVDRAERRAKHHQARLVALTALLTELQLNSQALPDSHVWHAHLLLPQSALDAALPHIASLPTDVAVAIEKATHAVARYNGAAQYSNERVQVGNGAAVRELATEAQAALDAAAEALDEESRRRPPHMPSEADIRRAVLDELRTMSRQQARTGSILTYDIADAAQRRGIAANDVADVLSDLRIEGLVEEHADGAERERRHRPLSDHRRGAALPPRRVVQLGIARSAAVCA